MDIIRVLRVIEYEGPREWVERTLANSIQGEKHVPLSNGGIIRAATLGVVPTILGSEPCVPITAAPAD